MKALDFKIMLEQLSNLSRGQKDRLRLELEREKKAAEVIQLMEKGLQEHPRCPHCGNPQLYRWGSSCGLQRYRCRQCQHTFNALTHTPLARLRHKERWITYTQALIDGISVRKAASHCGVAKNTSFKWRHRFLQAPAQQKAEKMHGIAEADETFFLESCKGKRNLPRPARKRGGKAAARGTSAQYIPVLVVRDRDGATADFRLSGVSVREIEPVLTPLLAPDVILCTDGASAYTVVAQRLGLTHRPVSMLQGIRVRGAFHIQNVNAYDSRLKQWLVRFHGVATGYLESYLGWRRMLERFGNHILPAMCLRAAIGKERHFQQLSAT